MLEVWLVGVRQPWLALRRFLMPLRPVRVDWPKEFRCSWEMPVFARFPPRKRGLVRSGWEAPSSDGLLVKAVRGDVMGLRRPMRLSTLRVRAAAMPRKLGVPGWALSPLVTEPRMGRKASRRSMGELRRRRSFLGRAVDPAEGAR